MLAIPGFALGALAGLLWEDPGLVAAYLFGGTQEVAWAPEEGDHALPPVAAAPEPVDQAPPAAAAAEAPAARPAAPSPTPTPAPAPKREARVSPPVRTAAAAVAGKLSIQVGAFSERAGADRLADALRGKGFPVRVLAGESSGASRWRVRVGPLTSRSEAEKTAARLKREEKLPTWIVEDDG
jgi:cell division protein FtsN